MTTADAWPGLAPLLADVETVWGVVPERLAEPTAEGVLWQVAGDQFVLRVPGVARYLVQGGRRVTIEPLGEDDAAVIRFLRGTPLAALAAQRGWVALHAAAVAGPPGAVVLAGYSGAGKSVLAAALVRRGWQLLADDVVILDDLTAPVRVWPTSGEITLWPEVVECLGRPAATERQTIDFSANLAAAPVPLAALIALRTANAPEEPRRLGGVESWQALMALSYNNHIAEEIVGPMGLVHQMLALARVAPMVSLSRQQGSWQAEALADAVEGMVDG